MKPYGVKRKDFGCCPGHDKFPRDTYANRTSKQAHSRDARIAHKRARAWSKVALERLLGDLVG